MGDFPLSNRIQSYWNHGDVEIDLITSSEDEHRIQLASTKRNPEKLMGSGTRLKQCVNRFLSIHRRFNGWQVEFAAIAPKIPGDMAAQLRAEGVMVQDLPELIADL